MKTLFLIFLFFCENSTVKLPDSVEKCSYASSDFDECLRKSVQKQVSLMDQPIKSVGLPTVEPLEVSKFSIGAGSGPVNVIQNFENAKISGLSKLLVKQATTVLEPNNLVFNFTVFIPNLEIDSDYSLNGRVLVLPIQGKGKAIIKLTNLTAVVHFPVEKYTKNNNTYIKTTSDATLKLPKLDLLYLNFGNLYNGNKVLSDTTNKVLNENWEPIFDDVRSGWEDFFKQVVENLFNRFFAKVPFKETIDNIPISVLET